MVSSSRLKPVFTLGAADLTTDLNFENSDNVTHLIVSGFTGNNGDDLDIDDDGTLDINPWTAIIDSVALIETDPLIEGNQVYSATRVGPDGIVVPGHVFRNPDGTGNFQIGALDPAGGEDTPGSTNLTPGDIPPVISLIGSDPALVGVGDVYADAGATAFDNLDGDVTGNIVVGGLPIDTSIVGSHIVTYDVTDSDGNPAIQVTRTVNVIVDEAPVVIVDGNDPETVGVGEVYVDAGARAIDALEGNLSGSIVVGGLPIDTSATGAHIVTYDVADSQGNAAHAERTVVVLDKFITAELDANVVINASGPTSADFLGFSVSSAGDFNGDGIEDIIVGNPPFNGKFGLNAGGIAYIYFGRSSNSQLVLSSFDDADIVFSGTGIGALGISVSSAGDFNGDGLDDVIVGASNINRAYVFFGRDTASQLILNSGTDADIFLEGTGDFGRSVAGAGDFNGDNFDDVIVGAREDDSSGQMTGNAYVFLGCDPAGVGPCLTSRTIADAEVNLQGQGVDDWFGASVASAGDFNGDGLKDVLVGAPRDDDNGDNSGRAFMFLGRVLAAPVTLHADVQAEIIVDGQLGDELGTSVASVEDFNGDGLSDVILGAPEANFTTFDTVIFDTIGTGNGRTGSAYVFLGRALVSPLVLDADQDAEMIINGHGFSTDFGSSVASAGDMDGDGLSEVIVGAPDDDFFGGNTGSASVFKGRELVSQLTLDADLGAETVMNGSISSSLGGSVAAAGDFNGDGVGDVIVGARNAETNNIPAGKAYVLFARQFVSNDIVLNLPGAGVSLNLNDNASTAPLSVDTATAIATADIDNNGEDDVIVSFPAGSGPNSNGGTYISRNQRPLVSLDTRTAEQVAVGDLNANGQDDLLIDFGVDGLSLWVDDSFAVPFIPLDPTALASGDIDNNGQDDMVMSFPGVGTISLKNFTTIVVLDSTIAETIETADVDGNGQADVIVSFAAGNGPGGTGGTYISRNDGALVLLDTKIAEQVAVGDLNASGQDDLLLDYGVDGLNLWVDDSFAVPFIPLDPVALASGDLDDNGFDDMVMSFPGVGTISLKNFTTIDVLDAAVAQDLAVGINLGVDPAAPDSLIISELMIDPAIPLDINGEWIEIYNVSGPVTDINGWTLTDQSANTHTIDNGGPLLIAPGEFLVLGVNADTLANGGVILDYQYSDITLNNGGDTISLISSAPTSRVINSFTYGPSLVFQWSIDHSR